MAYLEPHHSVFVIPTRDLAASMSFYRDALGLEVLEEWSELGRGALLRLAVNAEVELLELEGIPAQVEPRMGIGLEIDDRRVDEVYERLLERGFDLKGPPRVRPWGKRGFGAVAPEGTPVNVYGPAGSVTAR